MSQRVAVLGRRVLPILPEAPSRLVLGSALGNWPELWGMFRDGKRVRAVRSAYRLAFPNEDADLFAARWVSSRGEHLAASMIHMAREQADRRSRLVHPETKLELLGDRPCIVAVLHYSIDPVVALALLAANPERDFRWVVYPLQPDVEDDRALWLSRLNVPSAIARTFLPVTDPAWLVEAMRHLQSGGDVLLAIDSPFDGRRATATSLRVGATAMPLAPSVEFLWQRTAARLLFAWPQPHAGGGWRLHIDDPADTSELAVIASRWIEANRLGWAGWPFLRWRESSVSMRKNVTRLMHGRRGRTHPVDSGDSSS